MSYKTENEINPVKEFLDSLSIKEQTKIASVRNKIFELRTEYSSNEFKILYFFFINDDIVLLYGIRKKDQKLKNQDIETAESKMADWIRRKSN